MLGYSDTEFLFNPSLVASIHSVVAGVWLKNIYLLFLYADIYYYLRGNTGQLNSSLSSYNLAVRIILLSVLEGLQLLTNVLVMRNLPNLSAYI